MVSHALHVSPDGKKIIVGSGKGIGSHPNPGTVKPADPVAPADFKFRVHRRTIQWPDLRLWTRPTDAQLARYTQQVYANTPGQLCTKSARLTAQL